MKIEKNILSNISLIEYLYKVFTCMSLSKLDYNKYKLFCNYAYTYYA